MESSPGGRCGEIASDLFIIFVTAAQLIFFTRFHRYIAWYSREPDGTVTRLSVLTDEYFTWLPFPTTGSILVIVASAVMIVYDRYWFRQTASIIFNIIGIVIVVSLLLIFPFDFSVIPNATAVDVLPKIVRAFFILMVAFYGTTAVVMLVKFKRHTARQETG
jgi:hypothetical protein